MWGGSVRSERRGRYLNEDAGISSRPSSREDQVKQSEELNKLWCSHCGMSHHTKETRFKLVGYPNWWEDGHRKATTRGKPAAVVGNLAATIDSRSDSRVETGREERPLIATHKPQRNRSETIEGEQLGIEKGEKLLPAAQHWDESEGKGENPTIIQI